MTKSLLRALTPEAEAALGDTSEALIENYPFRVGRESRYQGVTVRTDRRGKGAAPTNDLYLLDSGRLTHVSREHFEIDHPEPDRFVLRERGSLCGTLVENEFIGGNRQLGETALEDGNSIAVGGPDSPYVFQFVVLGDH